MANRAIIDYGFGFIPKAPDFLLPKGQPAGLAELLVISGYLQQIAEKLNGGLSLGDATQASRAGNFNAQWIPDIAFTAANTAVMIPHGLKRRPVGYWPLRRDKAATLFDANIGSWSDTVLYLQFDTANALFSIIVL